MRHKYRILATGAHPEVLLESHVDFPMLESKQ